jgi:metal-sulfur cluster biosynthetic enzyme/nitrite reductase/ring-hydroxylating ferredoxin subunit
MAEFEEVAKVDELKSGESMSVIADDTPVLLVRNGDIFYAIEDMCSHDGQPLSGGPIGDGEVTCSRHGAKFDLKTGAARCMPATEPVRVFDVKVCDGAVYVGPQGASAHSSAKAAAEDGSGGLVGDVESKKASAAQVAEKEDSFTSAAYGPPPAAEELIEALKQVIDPELMINIVDLGLVYDVEQQDNGNVGVDMTLTSPACPAGPQIIQQAKMALERLAGVAEAEIKLTMTPPWTPERMTDEARDQVGIF